MGRFRNVDFETNIIKIVWQYKLVISGFLFISIIIFDPQELSSEFVSPFIPTQLLRALKWSSTITRPLRNTQCECSRVSYQIHIQVVKVWALIEATLVHQFFRMSKQTVFAIYEFSLSAYYTEQKNTIHQVTAMLATSTNVLFPDHIHLLTTGADDLMAWHFDYRLSIRVQ